MADLIAFFSRGDENYVNGVIKSLEIGNTEVAAGIVQKLTGGEVFQIQPVQAYSKDYNKCIAEARADQERDARPELKVYPESIKPYDVIYLGYPNYWGTMPMAVFTFLEQFDFAGKTIKPFCTHEGSEMGSSVCDIRRICPGAYVDNGLAIQGGSVQKSECKLKDWMKMSK